MIAVALAAALATPMLGIGTAEAIPPAANGCKASTNPGAEIGHYPANPGAMSGYSAACLFNNNTGTSIIATAFTFHDFLVAQWHNGAGRTVTGDGTARPIGSTSITFSSCAGITGYVNRGITRVGGLGIPPRTFVTSISGGCVATLNQPTTVAIPAGATYKLDNGAGRSVTDGVTTNASPTITSASANFTAADVGLAVSGTDVPAQTTLILPCGGATCTMSNPATATAGGAVLSIGGGYFSTSHRQVKDLAGTKTITTITSPQSRFEQDDVGLLVAGAGIPANTYITSVAGNVATTTGGMTASAAPLEITIGEASVTAPLQGETVAYQGVQLDLDPGFVAGSGSCAAEDAEGFATVASWNPPGQFSGAAIFNTQPDNTKALGQILFDTSVVDFSGFVVERRTATSTVPADPLNGFVHYDIVFPNAPTASAMCLGTPTSPGLGYAFHSMPTTGAQARLVTGTGRPGTTQLRATKDVTNYGDTSYVQSMTPGVTFTPVGDFNRTCFYGAGPITPSFICGNG